MHMSAIATVPRKGKDCTEPSIWQPLHQLQQQNSWVHGHQNKIMLHRLSHINATEIVLLHLPAPFPVPSAVFIASEVRCITGIPGIDAMFCNDTHVYAVVLCLQNCCVLHILKFNLAHSYSNEMLLNSSSSRNWCRQQAAVASPQKPDVLLWKREDITAASNCRASTYMQTLPAFRRLFCIKAEPSPASSLSSHL